MPSTIEIKTQQLILARNAYVNYVDRLEDFQENPFPPNNINLILAEISYALYQTYLNAARNALDEITPCSELDPNIQISAWRTCMESVLENEYGVKVDRFSFTFDDPNRDPQLQYNVQLQYISSSISNTAIVLKNLLINCLEECRQTAIDNQQPFNIDIDDFRAWTPAQTFKNIFGKEGLIEIRFDSSSNWASTTTGSSVPNPRILLANSTFVNPLNGVLYSEATVTEIIVHEFGHAFINFLGTSAVNWQLRSNPLNSNNAPTPLSVTVSGGSTGEPLISEAYLQATNGYYTGLNIDFGDTWFRPVTGYQITDEGVCAITNLNYGVITACSGGCGNGVEYLVDRQKNCIEDTNNANQCIPLNPSSPNSCIPSDSTAQAVATYARLPATYVAEFHPQTNLNLFQNERGITTQSSAPKEGLADLFKVAMTGDGITRLPSAEPRRIFFEQNHCRWLFQLLSDFIPEDDISFCFE